MFVRSLVAYGFILRHSNNVLMKYYNSIEMTWNWSLIEIET